jgi:hypothetical protein
MNDLTKVYNSKIEPGQKTFPAECPYCSAVTIINPILTEPMCVHFEDYRLYKREDSVVCEVDTPDDEVVVSEAAFRKSGSKRDNVEFMESGDLVQTDSGFDLRVQGVTVMTIPGDEILDILLGEEEDCDEITI